MQSAATASQAVALPAWPYANKANTPIRRTFKLLAPKA